MRAGIGTAYRMREIPVSSVPAGRARPKMNQGVPSAAERIANTPTAAASGQAFSATANGRVSRRGPYAELLGASSGSIRRLSLPTRMLPTPRTSETR
jgi:hypothetical protein